MGNTGAFPSTLVTIQSVEKSFRAFFCQFLTLNIEKANNLETTEIHPKSEPVQLLNNGRLQSREGFSFMNSVSKNDETLETWLVQVHGRVQGVGYRDACMRNARAQGITGWVRNRIDGSVELMLQGFKAQLAAMCSWLRHGIPAARVDRLEVSEVPLPAPRLDNFDRRPTL